MDKNSPILKYPWKKARNVEAPEVIKDDFLSDSGYFTEENGESKWKIGEGMLSTSVMDGSSLTCVHVYEQNVRLRARVRINGFSGPDASFAMMLRYNSADAWVRLVYTPDTERWRIWSRNGADFHSIVYRVRYEDTPVLCDKYKKLELGKWYDITFTLDGERAFVSVDGQEFFEVDGIEHMSPGRIGFFAENISFDIDSTEFSLLSGEGTVWRNAAHTLLPHDEYIEGGSVIRLRDGSLSYIHHSGVTYRSGDDGITWQKSEPWTDFYANGTYVNVYRLKTGELIRTATVTVDGKQYRASQKTSDEGVTWSMPSIIAEVRYKDSGAIGSSMNDKMFESPTTGRLFYTLTYDYSYAPDKNVDGRSIFTRFYYSDNGGDSWTKSETDAWEIPGNESATHFSECKMLECADGTVRMYCSWNFYGHIVYADSNDGGKTFGPLMHMEEFRCSASSMQFARDPYADNDSTYYMVWVQGIPVSRGNTMPRSRLSLAKTEDGKNWVYLGDVWRWESEGLLSGVFISHLVDPFIYVTEDRIVCGSGISERTDEGDGKTLSYWHQAQRQHIYSIKKDTLPDGKRLSKTTQTILPKAEKESKT